MYTPSSCYISAILQGIQLVAIFYLKFNSHLKCQWMVDSTCFNFSIYQHESNEFNTLKCAAEFQKFCYFIIFTLEFMIWRQQFNLFFSATFFYGSFILEFDG